MESPSVSIWALGLKFLGRFDPKAIVIILLPFHIPIHILSPIQLQYITYSHVQTYLDRTYLRVG